MTIKTYKTVILPLVAAACMLSMTQTSSADVVDPVAPIFTNFKLPTGWSIGSPLSTSQEWTATVSSLNKIDGIPNVSFEDAEKGLTAPTLTGGHTGFVASSGGFYSFTDWYTATAKISNHMEGFPSNAGTYVIVQTFASINDDDGAGNSGSVLGIDLTDLTNTPLVGVQHVNSSTYAHQSAFPSFFGPVDVQATIDEFWIPNFTGDFNAVVRQIIHSSFMGLKVDTFIASEGVSGAAPFAPVPEPASLSVLACAGLLLLRRKRST